jgi:hypothetical protein
MLSVVAPRVEIVITKPYQRGMCDDKKIKMNRMVWDGTRWNGNGISFENTVDYHSLMLNEIN